MLLGVAQKPINQLIIMFKKKRRREEVGKEGERGKR